MRLASISFRPLVPDDLALLYAWLNRRHVAAWWGAPSSLAEVEADYVDAIAGTVPHWCYISYHEEKPIGFVQAYAPAGFHDEGWWLDEHDHGVRGLDGFLANADQLGLGLGTAMIGTFVQRLFTDPAVSRVQADPAPDNARAIRCYEKAGFRAVTEIDTPDGRALLMHADRTRNVPRTTR